MSEFINTQEWVPIHTLPGFEACIEYYVNREGQIKSSKGKVEKLLKHLKHNAGYPSVKLTQRIGKGKVLTVLVHKLVAFAFLDKPHLPYGNKKGCVCIDHIDEDKTNCLKMLLNKQQHPKNGRKYLNVITCVVYVTTLIVVNAP